VVYLALPIEMHYAGFVLTDVVSV